ncbi:hypothetical protein HYPSUDRAFT_213837 [Hypholoma sublateritium FD-334 SS-4]|uniref:Uncharacterized protein n=1 Tax=Hypholoma sublateritium (strain FD-334 SS-4) TaxID=945553 RepID=A0A0D2PA00_HYPSF|nr:hypothetical protein HYPSUDRAFT_213837 [Hypholoma sublateritium FD-334 SS-4]
MLPAIIQSATERHTRHVHGLSPRRACPLSFVQFAINPAPRLGAPGEHTHNLQVHLYYGAGPTPARCVSTRAVFYPCRPTLTGLRYSLDSLFAGTLVHTCPGTRDSRRPRRSARAAQGPCTTSMWAARRRGVAAVCQARPVDYPIFWSARETIAALDVVDDLPPAPHTSIPPTRPASARPAPTADARAAHRSSRVPPAAESRLRPAQGRAHRVLAAGSARGADKPLCISHLTHAAGPPAASPWRVMACAIAHVQRGAASCIALGGAVPRLGGAGGHARDPARERAARSDSEAGAPYPQPYNQITRPRAFLTPSSQARTLSSPSHRRRRSGTH